MDPDPSMPFSKDPASGSYPDPDERVSMRPIKFLRDEFNYQLPFTPKPPKWSLPFRSYG